MQDGTNKLTSTRVVTLVLFIIIFLSAIQGTIVSTAVPAIAVDLKGVSLMNWVFSIYLFTSAVTTPVSGKLSDQFGRKRVLLVGLAIFTLGSLLAAFANSMELLIVWRAVQGIGAGAILPISYTIMADVYPLYRRSKIIGIGGATWAIASVISPLLGGLIIDNLSWHWVFLVNVPVIILAGGLLMAFFHEHRVKKQSFIDSLGVLYLAIDLFVIMLAIQLIGDRNIDLFRLARLGLVLIVGGVLFIRREHAFKDPLIPMDMFKDVAFVGQNAVAFLVSGFLMCMEVYLPNWIQGLLGQRASVAGMTLVPMALMWLFGALLSGLLIKQMRSRHVTTVGLVLLVIAACAMVMAPQDVSIGWFWLITSICGIGFGITITNTTLIVQKDVDVRNIGAATSFNTLARTMGQTFFVAVFGVFMNTSLRVGVLQISGASQKMINKLMNPVEALTLPQKLVPNLKTILFDALHNVFLVAAFMLVIALLINLFGKTQRS